jgi:hypothetical protein
VPTGLSVSPSSMRLAAPGILSLSISGSSPGVYNVTVTVSSSGVSRSALVQVRVTAAPGGSSNLFGVPPLVFYGLLGVFVVATAGVAVLVVRNRRRRSRVVSPELN